MNTRRIEHRPRDRDWRNRLRGSHTFRKALRPVASRHIAAVFSCTLRRGHCSFGRPSPTATEHAVREAVIVHDATRVVDPCCQWLGFTPGGKDAGGVPVVEVLNRGDKPTVFRRVAHRVVLAIELASVVRRPTGGERPVPECFVRAFPFLAHADAAVVVASLRPSPGCWSTPVTHRRPQAVERCSRFSAPINSLRPRETRATSTAAAGQQLGESESATHAASGAFDSDPDRIVFDQPGTELIPNSGNGNAHE